MNTKLTQGLLFAFVCCSFLILLPATTASAQTMPFGHVIIVVQENRTPDNLFQDPNLWVDPRGGNQRGADILFGSGLPGANQGALCVNEPTQNLFLYPLNALDACFDPDHQHQTAFNTSYNGGQWNGACNIAFQVETGCNPPNNPNYTYVQNYADNNGVNANILDPYFHIAENYGFANYMFQTNQGPSYAAHQFLFSGTSAPVGYDGDSSQNYEMFAAENPFLGPALPKDLAVVVGCTAYWDDPNDNNYNTREPDLESFNLGTENYFYSPQTNYTGFPCYTHNSLATLLEYPPTPQMPVSWKYYIQGSDEDTSIWTAPNSLTAICPFNPTLNPNDPTECDTTEWTEHVDDTAGDILNDIHNCKLKQVSWVIPDGHWSDHPGTPTDDGGPSWVAAIVNAIGGANQYAPSNSCSNNNPQMYWNGTSDATAIFITWDDWGGWYDHVIPWLPGNGTATGGYGNTTQGGNNQNDGAYYVYGFRVPLLVVSTYNTQCSVDCTVGGIHYPGYISGSIDPNNNPQQGKQQPYIHDFGSVLGFIEWNFNLPPYDTNGNGGNNCGIAGANSVQNGCNYEFADYFAPDGQFECGQPGKNNCGEPVVYPLEDFFKFTAPANNFTTITGAKYAPICFVEPGTTPCFGLGFQPEDPDLDAVEAQQQD